MPFGTRVYVATKNIQHYKRLLDTIFDDSARAVIGQLLKEAEAELDAAEAENELASKKSPIDAERVRRWRLKAEEYRATADISQSQGAKETYLRLAMDYEQLVDHWEQLRSSKTRSQKSG